MIIITIFFPLQTLKAWLHLLLADITQIGVTGVDQRPAQNRAAEII